MSRETKKEKILAVSKSLIIEKGYQGTSLRDIASNAGVTMGAIYHHFRNKEEIYLNVLKENNIVEYLEKIAALILDGNFPRNIEGVGRVIWQAARENKDFFKLIYVDILEFQGKNVKPLAMEFRSVTSQIAENILNEKIERGEIVPLHPHIILRK
ncbi:MAG: TetR/AcrR family transcriptional regulator, partial [Deltaproteobacteria bacterium]|nr:TetR/AcrR family transcriptional regulator [Deltaproteobacteria bacterium]